MNCNIHIHNDLKENEEMVCPFCDKQLTTLPNTVESCCSEQDMVNMNGMNTCVNCGLVHGCDYTPDYFNFYDNIHKIRKKSVYHQKYHIDNVLDSILIENNIQLTHHQRELIYKVFVEIDSVLSEVNGERKRMISIKYVIKQLFEMLRLPYKDINVTKSKRTLTYYKQYWKTVQSLIGDRIQLMINT